MRALGEVFPHYAVFAASGHDLLIVASDTPVPLPARAEVFEQPGVAKELWTVHMFSAGDFDARYLGSRATLEPLFASYGIPANSDYAPVLDLNAARQRFMEKSATDLVALLNAELPLLELAEPSRSRRPVNPLYKGAYAFDRVESTRLAWYAREFLVAPRSPAPESVPTQLQKDLELVKLRLMECRDPRELDVWLHSAMRVARAINPYLAPDDAGAVWQRILSENASRAAGIPAPLARPLSRRGGARAARMAQHASSCSRRSPSSGPGARIPSPCALAATWHATRRGTGALAHNKPSPLARSPLSAAARHADAASCEAEFRPYAEH